ncbi:DUF192 domain-containing protein [Candidatus Microgenomates bacterium]|nr:MAG: DUF192 domain-containing protein [Candidatus Microgenomates bacterium]
MRTILGLFALLFIAAIGIMLFQNYSKNNPSLFTNILAKKPTAIIGKQTFNITVAKSQKEKEIGLSSKKSLLQNEGMIFPFEKEDYYTFWMKDMKFPIDMIFLKKNKVVTIFSDVKPPKSENENLIIFRPEEPSDTVLELNAGIAKKYNLKKGDEIKFENL